MLSTAVGLVLVGGIFAGLTIAYMSMGTYLTNLQILIQSGDDHQKKYAKRILPVREKGHLLLITLLLGTVVVNESIPILMDSVIGGGVAAVVISTFLVVVFGEIIPNAVCNIYGLQIGAFFAPIIRVCMFLLWPIAFPIAKLLDCLLGEKEGVVYRRAELKTLIALHQAEHGQGQLSGDEVNIIQGVLDLSSKTVYEVMTPLSDVFSLALDAVLDAESVDRIRTAGHSRIPVYESSKDNLIGMLLVKSLVGYDVDEAWKVKDFPLSFLPIVGAGTELFDLLNFFQEGRTHMAAVTNKLSLKADADEDGVPDDPKPYRQEDSLGKDLGFAASDISATVSKVEEGQPRKVVGIVTLEDVIEELLGEEIVDETDVYADMQSKERAVRKPWPDLVKSIHGYYETAKVPIRIRPSPAVGAQAVNANVVGTEREPLLSKSTPNMNTITRSNRKEQKKKQLLDKAVQQGLLPPGEAGEAVAGLIKRKELKKLIRRQTEPISPRPKDPEDEVVGTASGEAGGGQNL
ncbi:hypothetical protein DFJ74DRAFT_705032 [Hyaloraphidium curvatum]|nr:hypothetical protein DFJ74DRAFT_705032 [Hyaloraphidium curvatum]